MPQSVSVNLKALQYIFDQSNKIRKFATMLFVPDVDISFLNVNALFQTCYSQICIGVANVVYWIQCKWYYYTIFGWPIWKCLRRIAYRPEGVVFIDMAAVSLVFLHGINFVGQACITVPWLVSAGVFDNYVSLFTTLIDNAAMEYTSPSLHQANKSNFNTVIKVSVFSHSHWGRNGMVVSLAFYEIYLSFP